jgi:periplasmic divalent cation tolerance protein
MAPRTGVAMTALLVYSACPDAASARRIADALVGERLAACVSVLPGMVSTYRWQGAIERADEVLLVAKTVAERREALQARLVELHPYELPEVLAVEAAALPAYHAWIARETRADATP